MADLKIIKKGEVFVFDFGHGAEPVQCAGRSPVSPETIGFYTEDGGLFIVKDSRLKNYGLKYVD